MNEGDLNFDPNWVIEKLDELRRFAKQQGLSGLEVELRQAESIFHLEVAAKSLMVQKTNTKQRQACLVDFQTFSTQSKKMH